MLYDNTGIAVKEISGEGERKPTGALLDRLTHHVHILEINGESYRLKSSKKKKGPGTP